MTEDRATGAPTEVLVVAETAEATAETVILVETVRRLTARPGVDVRVLLFRGGDAVAELVALAPTTVVADLGSRSAVALFERLAFAVRLRSVGFRLRAKRLGLRSGTGAPVVYLHSVLGVQVLRYLPDPGPHVVCRVTERAIPLDHVMNGPDLALLVARVDRFLAVSQDGVRALTEQHSVPEAKVRRFPETVLIGGPTPRATSAKIRAELGLSATSLVVGSFAAVAAEEPPDLVVMLARLLERRMAGQEVEALCVVPEAACPWVAHDIERAGLAGWVHVFDKGGELAPLVAVCDILVLMTRLDSYPREYLDAAARGVPLVCFETNELAEVVGDDEGGFVVPYLDVVAVADRVGALIEDRSMIDDRGAAIVDRLRASHSVDHTAERLWAELVDRRT